MDGDIIRILFVQPFIKPQIYGLIFPLIYSLFRKIAFFDNYLAFQILAAVTPKQHTIKLIDERFEDINFDEECDIVGITCVTGFAPRAYEIADEFRKREKTVVIGGPHVTVLPDEAKQHADSIVVGEAELTWPQLLKDFEEGNLKPFYRQEKPVNPELIPIPRREIIGKHRRPVARIQATRGCPYDCEFCAVPTLEGTFLRKRPIENVIKEIKAIPQKFMIFSDSSLTIDPEYTKELFRNMKGLKKKFNCFGNMDVLNSDEELLKLAKEAGCIVWYVGFESISKETIDRLGKKTNNVDEYASTVKKIHKYGMAVSGSFILGFDEDPPDVAEKTIKAMYELKIDLAEINILTPFPGTPLFKRLDNEDRILTKDWFHYREGQHGTTIVFKPKSMSVEEVYSHYTKAFKHWFYDLDRTKRTFRSLKLGIYPFVYTAILNTFHI
jgi:radical SAM superfamily enzyme YgiQ (UPF0313 family)